MTVLHLRAMSTRKRKAPGQNGAQPHLPATMPTSEIVSQGGGDLDDGEDPSEEELDEILGGVDGEHFDEDMDDAVAMAEAVGLTEDDERDADEVLGPPPSGHMTRTYRCPVKLTEAECAARGVDLAKLNDKLASLKNEKRENASIFTGHIKDTEAKIAELGLTIKSKEEMRDVNVYEQLDANAKVVRVLRADTHEELMKRQASEADLQIPLLPPEATVEHSTEA